MFPRWRSLSQGTVSEKDCPTQKDIKEGSQLLWLSYLTGISSRCLVKKCSYKCLSFLFNQGKAQYLWKLSKGASVYLSLSEVVHQLFFLIYVGRILSCAGKWNSDWFGWILSHCQLFFFVCVFVGFVFKQMRHFSLKQVVLFKQGIYVAWIMRTALVFSRFMNPALSAIAYYRSVKGCYLHCWIFTVYFSWV